MQRIRAAAIGVALAALTLRAGAPDSPDVHGTARAGTHPAANAVVWLEAPNAPHSTDRRPIVLDQRNLDFSPHVWTW